jgi:hypothetical protein
MSWQGSELVMQGDIYERRPDGFEYPSLLGSISIAAMETGRTGYHAGTGHAAAGRVIIRFKKHSPSPLDVV